MANQTAWIHFREIMAVVSRLESNTKQIAKDIDRLREMKEEILDNPIFKAELKKIIDIYPDATMTSLIADYTKFQALRDWLEENNYI